MEERNHGGIIEWRMEKVEPRQGMRGGEEHWRTSRTVCHRLVTPLLLLFFCVVKEKSSLLQVQIKQDSEVGECKERGESVTISGEM